MSRNYKFLILFCLLPMLSLAAGNPTSPSRAALIDTGYDSCLITSGTACEKNKNLLFRGDQPLTDAHTYNPKALREKVFTYLQEFKQVYATDAELPNSLADLNDYRIVIVNLLYDWADHGSDAEFNELTHEFKYSTSSSTLQVPQQHKIYNLDTPFNGNTFSFEWWPITMLGEINPGGLTNNINWPNQELFPVPRSNQFYKPMDLPYLITGAPYKNEEELDAIDIASLLRLQPNDKHPLLIFIHCVAGKDRTGAVTLSYLMKHGGYGNISNHNTLKKLARHRPASFSQAMTLVTQQHYPTPRNEALLVAQAYCLTLDKPASDCDL